MADDQQPLIANAPVSNGWQPFTDSKFSEKHLTKQTKKKRTSGAFPTLANLIKLFVGIAFISVPHSIAEAGLYASAVGFIYIMAQSVFCVYLILQARNRFKTKELIDICDLGAELYGPWMKPIMSILLVTTNSIFLICYIMFFGTQAD